MSTKRFTTTNIMVLTAALTLATAALAADLTIDWYTVDGGGVMQSTGGGFELSATIGQADAGLSSGGGFQLTGGFWFEQPLGDCNATGIADLLDHADFADCLTGPGGGLTTPDCNCFDVDGDGDGDLFDAALIQESFPG